MHIALWIGLLIARLPWQMGGNITQCVDSGSCVDCVLQTIWHLDKCPECFPVETMKWKGIRRWFAIQKKLWKSGNVGRYGWNHKSKPFSRACIVLVAHFEIVLFWYVYNFWSTHGQILSVRSVSLLSSCLPVQIISYSCIRTTSDPRLPFLSVTQFTLLKPARIYFLHNCSMNWINLSGFQLSSHRCELISDSRRRRWQNTAF